MLRFLLTIIFSFIYSSCLFSAQRADSFIISAYSDHYKVLAPTSTAKNISIIIENKMLVNLIGRVESSKGALIENIRVPAGEYRTIDLKTSYANEVYSFIPLSPAFQSVELKIGQEAYEIPAKR